VSRSAPGAPARPRHLVVAGGGLTAWMTAAVLARALNPERWSTTLVGADGTVDSLEPFGAADATLPWPTGHHPALAIDDRRIVARTGGGFSFGIALSGWTGDGSSYFQPFSTPGAPLGPVPFHHLAVRLRRAGVTVRLANYSLAALAAQAGRFEQPGRDPRSVLSTCEYGLHLATGKLADWSREQARAAGVATAPGRVEQVEHAPDGSIAALLTSGGQRIEGDLFLDCTGAEGRLIASLPETGWEDWSGWLPCDRILSAVADDGSAPLPYSHVQAHAAGWTRHLPLQGRAAFDTLYSSGLMDDKQAIAALRRLAGAARLNDLQARYVRLGRRGRVWWRNCVALGAAAALIDPVAVTNLHLLRLGLDLLLRLLPAGRSATVEAAEYNRRFTALLDHARDFTLAHYKLNGRAGEPLWDACRDMAVPDSLDYKLRLYASRGRVALYDEEPLDEVRWINLFDEQGVTPRACSPIAEGLAVADMRAHAERVRAVMIEAVGRMPAHAEFLAGLQAGDAAAADGRREMT